MEPLGIALIGCGTVGGGVARLLLENRERLAARAGRPLVLRRVGHNRTWLHAGWLPKGLFYAGITVLVAGFFRANQQFIYF